MWPAGAVVHAGHQLQYLHFDLRTHYLLILALHVASQVGRLLRVLGLLVQGSTILVTNLPIVQGAHDPCRLKSNWRYYLLGTLLLELKENDLKNDFLVLGTRWSARLAAGSPMMLLLLNSEVKNMLQKQTL
jgi:hypothetical protein